MKKPNKHFKSTKTDLPSLTGGNQLEKGNNLWIQRFVSIIGIVANIVAIALNIMSPPKEGAVFNITTFVIYIIIFIYTCIKESKSRQWVQFILFMLVGFASSALANRALYIGEILIIIGLFVMFKYNLIKEYKAIFLVPFYLLSLIIKVNVAKNDGTLELTEILLHFFTTCLSFTLVGFTTTVINIDIKRNRKIKEENDAKIRFSENLNALSHWMDFSIERAIIKDLQNNITDKYQLQQINLMKRRIEGKYETRENMLHCINTNNEFEISSVNIAKLIDSIIALHELNKVVKFHIDFQTEYNADIELKAVPFEVYFFLQNIISNSVEAITKDAITEFNSTPDSHQVRNYEIIIKLSVKNETAIIEISDTGPGFPSITPGQLVDINTIKSTKQTGGFGLNYIKSISTRYNWDVKIRNLLNGGCSTEVIINNYKKE